MRALQLIIILSLTFCAAIISAQQLTGSELIEKSIKYHDPDGVLTSASLTFRLGEERPNGATRQTSVTLDIQKETTTISSLRDGHKIVSTWNKGESSFSLDGLDKISNEDVEKYRLTDDRLTMMKDYYRYLWHLPTALVDPGSIVSPKVESVDFFGKSLLQVKVTYNPEIGKDIWYFYFNPKTYALSGYRFYHDEAINDGEYILLSGETAFKNLRLPKRREWYTHKEAKYLGADILESIKKK